MNISPSIIDSNKRFLLIDRIQGHTQTLGPGVRAVVWFHGCSRKCPGCIAANMNISTDFEQSTPGDLLESIKSTDDIEGITISGGEPFDQNIGALHEFLHGIKTETNLSVMAYTGYLMKELVENRQTRGLLRYIDILVDGPYVQSLDFGQLWRGSENQQIHFLSNRYASLKNVTGRKGRSVEVSIVDGRAFSFTGIPPKGFRKRLEDRLSEKDLAVVW